MMVTRRTSHNRTVYEQTRKAGLTPPVGGSGYGSGKFVVALEEDKIAYSNNQE
jgi:hypothetical protein